MLVSQHSPFLCELDTVRGNQTDRFNTGLRHSTCRAPLLGVIRSLTGLRGLFPLACFALPQLTRAPSGCLPKPHWKLLWMGANHSPSWPWQPALPPPIVHPLQWEGFAKSARQDSGDTSLIDAPRAPYRTDQHLDHCAAVRGELWLACSTSPPSMT
jgi:hypothetical protein